MMHKFSIIFIFLVSILLLSCKDDNTTEPEQTVFDVQGETGFVGKVEGTNAFIAILMMENEGIVYACNGDEEIYEWFRGSATEPNKISLVNNHGAQVSAEFTDDSFVGEITLSGGSKHSFTATPSKQEDSGIFHISGDVATQNEIEGGWIVNSDGEERGAFRISRVFQNTPLRSGIGDLTDGTSNTLSLFGFSVTLVHFTFP